MRHGRRTLFTILFILLECSLVLSSVRSLTQDADPIAAVFGTLQFLIAIIFAGLWFQVRRTERTLSQSLSTPIDLIFSDGAKELKKYLEAVKRKESLLMPQVIEGRIDSQEDLARVLERLVSTAYRISNAESAELAIFDRTSGGYHSSIVVGRPFRESIDEVVQGNSSDPRMLIEPISFAGIVLGALRIGLPKEKTFTDEHRGLLRFLALQSCIALVNADFVSELLRMRQLSEDSVKAKTGFLANLSHELRGPLGIIINAAELVLDELCGPVTEDQRETLGMVRSNGNHLLELINDVLDYAKVESGKIIPQKVDIAVSDLLLDIASVVRTQADTKKHVIKTEIPDSLIVSCDRRHIRQMMINMLTNAIKYTPDGGTITLEAERMPGNKIKISVRDTGIGIAVEDRQKVFNAFERVEHTYALKQVGTGLGMPLTKRLAEINGGTLDFNSMPGLGSVFWIQLPTGSDQRTEVSTTGAATTLVNGKGIGILMLARADNERKLCERYLSERNFRVVSASNQNELLEVMARIQPVLVVIDENVSDEFVVEPALFVRDLLQSTAIPILLMSSKAFVFDVERTLKSGVDRHVAKPISLSELGAICQELIENEARVTKKGEGAASTTKAETYH